MLDNDNIEQEQNIEQDNTEQEEQGVDSGVEGVRADDVWKDNTPVFDVNSKEFFNNMRIDRNRMRFSNQSKVSQFMQGTKYRKPFYMRHTDKNGQQYLKKVK